MGGEGCINWPGLRIALITRKLGSGCHRTSNWEQGRMMLKQYLGWQWRDFRGGPVAKLHSPNAGGLGLIPGQGTRSHMLQLRVHMPQLKTPHATRKTQVPKCYH